jgi:tetratricopeptide (TPR) repeat protein
MKLVARLYVRPFAAMSAILDEGRILLAFAFAAAVAFLMRFGVNGHDLSAIVVLVSPFKILAIVALAFVPVMILIVNWREGFGGAATILRRDYTPVLVCVLMAWAAALLPFAVLAWGLRLLHAPAVAIVAFWAAANVYFLFLSGCAIRTSMGTSMPLALTSALLATVAGGAAAMVFAFVGNGSYLLFSPWLLFYGYRYLQTDLQLAGSSLRSRQSFRRCLEMATINPRDSDAQYQLGLVYLQRRQFSEAAARFRKAIEIDPQEPDALYQLGRLDAEQGRFEDSLASLRRAAAVNDKLSSSEVWREIGTVEFQLGHLPQAESALEKYTTRREYDPEGLFWYGKVLRALGKDSAAGEVFERAIEAVKTSPSHRRGRLRKWSGQSASEMRTLAKRA